MKSSAPRPSGRTLPRLPEPAVNGTGQPRRVGIELEFGGLDLDAITGRLQREAGGTIERISNYEAKLRDTRVGDIGVELDALLFRELKVKGFLDQLGLDLIQPDLGNTIETLLATEARRFVPFEIVFSPVEIARLPELDALCATFRPVAEGTGASWFNAFGLHLNPELPRADAATVLRYLRAFLCRYDELRIAHAVDATRAFSPFIDAFPKEYVGRVLDPGYAPDTGTFIDDYLDANATRNRPLDLLPVLAWLDEERVNRRLPDEKINRRPTLHYRLPNCRIDEADWSITREWNVWMRVEDLAADEAALRAALPETLAALRGPFERLVNWINPA